MIIYRQSQGNKVPVCGHFHATPTSFFQSSFCVTSLVACVPCLPFFSTGMFGSVIQSCTHSPSDFKDQTISAVTGQGDSKPQAVLPLGDLEALHCCPLSEMPLFLTCQSSVMYFCCPNMTLRDLLPYLCSSCC